MNTLIPERCKQILASVLATVRSTYPSKQLALRTNRAILCAAGEKVTTEEGRLYVGECLFIETLGYTITVMPFTTYEKHEALAQSFRAPDLSDWLCGETKETA